MSLGSKLMAANMVMITTAAKKRAAEQRRTLRSLVDEGLRAVLAGRAGCVRRRTKIRWVTAHGGLPPGLDVSDRERLHEWIRRDR